MTTQTNTEYVVSSTQDIIIQYVQSLQDIASINSKLEELEDNYSITIYNLMISTDSTDCEYLTKLADQKIQYNERKKILLELKKNMMNSKTYGVSLETFIYRQDMLESKAKLK